MLATLEMLTTLDFDILICNGRASDASCSIKLPTPAKRKAFFKSIAEKLV